MLNIITLGAAAGGGLPQWNCRCEICGLAWEGQVPHQTQVSLAVSADGGQNWFLINASPDIRVQIAATPTLWPRKGQLRHSPIAGVILTNGEIDAVAGLLSLREGQAFGLYAHPTVLATLEANSILNVLDRAKVPRRAIFADQAFEPLLPDGQPSGLEVSPFTVPGKRAWYLEGENYDPTQSKPEDGDTLGLTLRANGSDRVAHVILAAAEVTPELAQRVDGADHLFFDGTLWRDEEMIEQGLSAKTGKRMGHISISGPEGSMAAFAGLTIRRRVFVHINNSNPIWCPTSPARHAATAAGWHVPAPGEGFSI